MSIEHTPGTLPPASAVELGRGADGVVIEVLDHPEVVIKTMNHRFKLGSNRVKLELRGLHAVLAETNERGATRVFNHGMDAEGRSWLERAGVRRDSPRRPGRAEQVGGGDLSAVPQRGRE